MDQEWVKIDAVLQVFDSVRRLVGGPWAVLNSMRVEVRLDIILTVRGLPQDLGVKSKLRTFVRPVTREPISRGFSKDPEDLEDGGI